jgi:RNA polymerase-associated protein LEO1
MPYLLKNKIKKGTTTKPTQPILTSKVTSKDFIYLTQKASAATSTEYDDGDDDDKPTTTILQAVTSLKSKFIPRPSSLHSEAHKQFALESHLCTMKRAKIAEYVSFEDPEKQKLECICNKDDLMKQQSRSGGRKSYSNNAGRRRVGMNRGYMEDDEYDNVNIRRLKKSTMDEDDMDYGDDDIQSDDDEWSKRKKRGFEQSRKNKKTTRSKNRFDESDESDESDEDEFDDDDDEEDFVAVRKRGNSDSARKRKAGIFDDDDDSDE